MQQFPRKEIVEDGGEMRGREGIEALGMRRSEKQREEKKRGEKSNLAVLFSSELFWRIMFISSHPQSSSPQSRQNPPQPLVPAPQLRRNPKSHL